MDEWEPQPGERVRIAVGDSEGLDKSVPILAYGDFLRYLGDHERFPCEVMVEFRGRYTYARDEIFPVQHSRNSPGMYYAGKVDISRDEIAPVNDGNDRGDHQPAEG